VIVVVVVVVVIPAVQLFLVMFYTGIDLTYTGCGRKKWTPKFFRRFLSNRLGF